MRSLLKRIVPLILILFVFAGCVNTVPHLIDGVTPPPAFTSAPSTQPPEQSDAPAIVTAAPNSDANVDALGNHIYTGDHYERYLSFHNVLVYEDEGETLVDLTITNDYPESLLCAVNITFFNEADEKIASSSLQMPDGSFLLALESGDTPLYARVLTDIVLTDKRFELTFDPQTGVVPE